MYKEKVEFLASQARKLDPYYEKVNSKKIFWEFKDEFDEAVIEFKNNNIKGLEWELWDIFWDFQLLLNKLEDEGKIEINNIYKNIYEKMSSRKSFLMENKKVTENEAIEIWNKAKVKEWYSKDRLWDNERTELYK